MDERNTMMDTKYADERKEKAAAERVAADRVSDMEYQLLRVDEQLNDLREALTDHLQRLVPVLLHNVPASVDKGAQSDDAEPEQSVIRGRIAEHERIIRYITADLRHITGSLDI